MSDLNDKKKQVIGLFGEMNLAMELHERGWQIHKSYIDEGIDFLITKYFCKHCKKFTNQLIESKAYKKGSNRKCVTNKCQSCGKPEIKLINRAIQVKTSEGVNGTYSFHPKIRYDMNGRIFYVWIAVVNKSNVHYYLFNTGDVKKFDDVDIDTYQITDNQKTSLRISEKGEILNQGRKYDFSCFKKFHNNFECLEEVLESD